MSNCDKVFAAGVIKDYDPYFENNTNQKIGHRTSLEDLHTHN